MNQSLALLTKAKANCVMGVRMKAEGFSDDDSCAFSQDILRIEISGPEVSYLPSSSYLILRELTFV